VLGQLDSEKDETTGQTIVALHLGDESYLAPADEFLAAAAADGGRSMDGTEGRPG
jgi:hypothetical protein